MHKYKIGDKVRVKYLGLTFDASIVSIIDGGYIAACKSGDTHPIQDQDIMGPATGEDAKYD